MAGRAVSFEAKYLGKCPHCGDRINPGDEVEYAGDDLIHTDCDEAETVERVTATCTSCFLQKPCPCEDDQ